MGVDKRALLRAFLRRQGLYKKLSADEIRLFLLLIVFAEERGREEKLSWENVRKYLGESFGKGRLKRAASSLEEMELVKVDPPAAGVDIVYELL